MIRRILARIGHQPYPAERPYLWHAGTAWTIYYPGIPQRFYLRVRPRSRANRLKLLVGRIGIYCDRARFDYPPTP